MKRRWKYCVVANIVKTRIDENGILRYGTPAFTGGSKVYLCGKIWNRNRNGISALGLNRGKRYFVEWVSVDWLENLRVQRVFRPGVLNIMDDMEFEDGWWQDTPFDLKDTKEFVQWWNDGRKPNFDSPDRRFWEM